VVIKGITRDLKMTEPTSSSAAGLAVWKIGIAYGVPAALAAVIVMVLTRPRDTREWILALTTTLSGSIYGGAFAIRYFGWQSWLADPNSAMVLGGVYLVCGLPGWVLVRAAFAWIEKRRHKDLGELYQDAKKDAS
jgi:hypothetical protein